MILVMGHAKLATGEGERVRELLVRHMADVSAEEGCEFYNFAFDAADPDLVRITERWATAEALAAHGQAPHQKEFGRRLAEAKIQEISVDAYDGQFRRKLI